jgi:hypothetical protein
MFVVALSKVIACDKKYGAVEDHIQNLCLESKIGDAIWGFASVKLVDAKVAKVINAAVAEFSKLPMNTTTLHNARFAIAALASAVHDVAKLPARRDIEVPFQGDTVLGFASSIQAQVNVCLTACWKGAAVSQSLLTGFFSEDSPFLARLYHVRYCTGIYCATFVFVWFETYNGHWGIFERTTCDVVYVVYVVYVVVYVASKHSTHVCNQRYINDV